VKLLFDQNLSRHLVPQLAVEFPGSCHVTEIEPDTATDSEIWSYAGEHGFVIVSKDSDFRQLAFLNGPPPKAVWLRMGNASTIEIRKALIGHGDAIHAFSESEDEALLIITPHETT
jgi:predicted nuclease of predicted toxin-antitoxin system